jgi:hypothetical protein
MLAIREAVHGRRLHFQTLRQEDYSRFRWTDLTPSHRSNGRLQITCGDDGRSARSRLPENYGYQDGRAYGFRRCSILCLIGPNLAKF